jgi:Cu-Zn family superoxide dismutase
MKAICNLEKYGTVIFSKICKNDNCKKHGVNVSFNLYNFEKNVRHAIHIHEFGDTTDGCKSLGLHYNPENTTHGSFLYPYNQRHAGDLINNFPTDNNGSFMYEYNDPSIKSIQSILGRSIVIHKGIDDLGQGKGDKKKESLISGNAGERIICGVIGLKKS